MMKDWQECPRGDIRPQWAAIYVTMNPKGEIAMSSVTYERLGSPPAFVLLYDAARNRIGLKPAGLDTRNAYPVRCSRGRGARRIRGHRLMHEFRIDIPETVRFHDADTDADGVLILNLQTARPAARAVNHWTKRAKPSG